MGSLHDLRRLAGLTLVLALLATACGGTTGSDTPADGPATQPDATQPDVTRPAADSPDAPALASALNQAGARLFLAQVEGQQGDVVLSPLSIGVAFGMAAEGAAGAAAEGLDELFGFPVDGEARLAAFNTLLQQVATSGEGDDEPVVALANRQFPDESFSPEPAYSEAIARWFGAAAQPLPLQTDPSGSRETINRYVAEQTRDLIPALLPEGFLTPQSVLVLVNALYVAADWATPFGKYPTEEAPFTRLDGSTTTAALMHDRELFGPGLAGDGFVAAAKPYEGQDLDLLVVVPDEGRFEEVQARLAEGLLADVAGASSDQAVELLLPRFTSAATLDLRALIEGGLGLGGIFSDDYPGIGEGAALTAAVHGVDLSTDEQGTVAAAATALGFEESGPGPADLVVRADRPFLYAVRHVPTGAVLFLGRVTDPEDPGPREG